MAPKRRQMPFEGKLVEVVGPCDSYSPTGDGQVVPLEAGEESAIGERGGVLGAVEKSDYYVVETFSGQMLRAKGASLKEVSSPSDVDLTWPFTAEGHNTFANEAGRLINRQGYCVVQMFGGEPLSKKAAEQARQTSHFQRMDAEVAGDYLGSKTNDKVAWLPLPSFQSEEDVEGEIQLVDVDKLGNDFRVHNLAPLERCDRLMTNFCALMWPVAPEFGQPEEREKSEKSDKVAKKVRDGDVEDEDDENDENHEEDEEAEDEEFEDMDEYEYEVEQDTSKKFMAWGRTSALIRTSLDSPEEARSLAVSDRSDDWLQKHETWLESRKLCMAYIVEAEGGEFTLVDEDGGETSIPLIANRMVIFRHDFMSYTYAPAGRNLTLQSWILDEPSEDKERMEMLRNIDGPEEPEGERVNVMSLHTRYPGCGFEPTAYWNMFCAGTDAQISTPIQRWDIDVYYREEHTLGYSMSRHGGLMTQDEIELFDNKFFNIAPEEAMVMAPLQRISLEVGYEALFRGGHRREDLKGWECGVFMGDSGSDWDQLCFNVTPERWAGRLNAISCCRLSHTFGLTGPTCTSETACSSSLVAVGVGHTAMKLRQPDQHIPNIATNLKDALIIGLNTCLGPGTYIALSGPGMLSSKGRCFTFDHSTDGFARGEGCGSLLFKHCVNSLESIGRYAMLIGSCVNQDGRSASMTAPHGPSQQDVIRASMREADVEPRTTTICECHGTGTALGDPIEVGALRGVMQKGRGDKPILMTSAKSNMGHLEAGAGCAGLIKCILMLNYSSGSPNIHLVAMNPHLDVAGFPVYCETENCDFMLNSGVTGVSSFGFGGTNARADVWGHAQAGPRKCITGTVLKQKAIYL